MHNLEGHHLPSTTVPSAVDRSLAACGDSFKDSVAAYPLLRHMHAL